MTSLITELSRKRDEISTTPRRQCLLHPGPRGDSGILGKVSRAYGLLIVTTPVSASYVNYLSSPLQVAHVAQVVDDDVARVLSWHMASDMDCVLTLTTEKVSYSGQSEPSDGIKRKLVAHVCSRL